MLFRKLKMLENLQFLLDSTTDSKNFDNFCSKLSFTVILKDWKVFQYPLPNSFVVEYSNKQIHRFSKSSIRWVLKKTIFLVLKYTFFISFALKNRLLKKNRRQY